jgi:hypothetical protein
MKTATKTKAISEKKTVIRKRAKKTLALVDGNERESQYRTLHLMVNSYYDFDRHRLALEQRHKPKRGIPIQLAPIDIATLKSEADAVSRFMDGISKDIRALLRQMPFYREWLKDFDGVGEVGAAIILSQFDIQKADTVSKMWAFAGLAPLPARRCRACHNVVTSKSDDALYEHASYSSFRSVKQSAEEKAKPCPVKSPIAEQDTYESGVAMKPVKGEKLRYNAWLRSKLVGAIGSAQITNNTRWRKVYDDYKHRKLTAGWGSSDGHRHNAAIRYMVKMMLLEIWKAWRAFEGLVVRPSYHEEKQGGHGFYGR